MAGLTAARLRTAATELRTLASTLGGWADDIGTMRGDARGSLDDVDESWGDASTDGDWWDWTPFVDFDWSNESVVEVNMFPVDPEVDRQLDPDAVWTHAP